MVNKFNCRLLFSSQSKIIKTNNKSINDTQIDHLIILSDDNFILFNIYDNEHGKIVFWSSLYSITDANFNKKEKNVILDFYDSQQNKEYRLQLGIENILLFRDTLIKKIKALKIKVETDKINNQNVTYNRLSMKQICTMKIEDIEKNANLLYSNIKGGIINDYTVSTYTSLMSKLIEHYSIEESKKDSKYLSMLKEVLGMEEVKQMQDNNQKEIEEAIKEINKDDK